MQSKAKHKQTKLFKAITQKLAIGIARSYALLYMCDDEGDYYKIVSYDNGPAFFKYITNTSDSILEISEVYCWGLNFKGLHPNQQVVVFETSLNTIEEDILCSQKFFYGVPLFQSWTTNIGFFLKDKSLYYRKFICEFDKFYSSKTRQVIFRANDMHYCILEKYGEQYFPLGYALIDYVNTVMSENGLLEDCSIESIDSELWTMTDSSIAALLDGSLDEYFSVFRDGE